MLCLFSLILNLFNVKYSDIPNQFIRFVRRCIFLHHSYIFYASNIRFEGQFIGFQDFTLFLKARVSYSCISGGNISQIFDPKYNMLSKSLHTVSFLGILKKSLCLKSLLSVSFKGNKSLMMVRARPLTTPNISIKRKRRFLVCIEAELSFSSSCSKVDTLSL